MNFKFCSSGNRVSDYSMHQWPNTDQTVEDAEDLLVKELKTLSFQEQNKAAEDVHCVPCPDERPDAVEASLHQFEQEVQREKTYLYEMAEKQNRHFVEDRDFRLMFLRSELFMAKPAVRRMMKFLQQKAMYFGESKLTKHIVWSDLEEKDIEVLESGFWTVLNDRSNRPVVVVLNHLNSNHFPTESIIRASYFTFFVMLENVDAQRKGFVGIFYDMSLNFKLFDPKDVDKFVTLWSFNKTVPIRTASNHVCIKSDNFPWFVKAALLMSGNRSIVRTRIHQGSDVELLYNLQSYGIPQEVFPVSFSGDLRRDMLTTWFQDYKDNKNVLASQTPSAVYSKSTFESPPVFSPWLRRSELSPVSNKEAYATANPRPRDFLLGRGKRCQNHIGNRAFRKVCEAHIEEYDHAKKAEKRDLARRLAYGLIASGAKFLKQCPRNSTLWVESDMVEVEKTVMQLFRSFRKDPNPNWAL